MTNEKDLGAQSAAAVEAAGSIAPDAAPHAEPCYYCKGSDVCPTCKGEQEIRCECSECGDGHWTVCHDCSGKGNCSECAAQAKYEAEKIAKAEGRS